MSLPFGQPDTTFESFLQELPADYWELAIEFKAFTRSRKIKTPAQLLQVVMSYCGLDAVLREAARGTPQRYGDPPALESLCALGEGAAGSTDGRGGATAA